MKTFLVALCTLAAAGAGQAHVGLEYRVAPAATAYKATFQVGHGCGASATRQVSVQLPAGVTGAHPMPKAGWSLAVDKAGDRVTRVTWTANTDADKLPSEFYDEFVLMTRTPDRPGTVYWPVVQVCDEGRIEWTQVPGAGQPASGLKTPAAALEVLPNESAAGGHKH